MPRVTFARREIEVEAPVGASLLDVVRQARFRFETPCSGAGACGKCRVRLDEANRDAVRIVDNSGLTEAEIGAGWVLLCSTLVEADVTVELPDGAEQGLRILEEGRRLELPVEPFLAKRLARGGRITEVLAGGGKLAEEAGDTVARLYGVAVDIGSTTIVASLLDLSTGARLASASALNPQAVRAQDVLSRIQLGAKPVGLQLLHHDVTGEIDRLIRVIAIEARLPRRRIYEVVIAGNTCMLHLAAGVDPEPLGRFPYTPNFTGDRHLPVSALRLSVAPIGLVYVPPVVSGFAGADITVGVLATGLAERAGTTLFVDIGTNGEMVLARDGRLQATSTAAGPAFEGMNISCGMRAARGAIERVGVVDGRLTLATIDDAPSAGLCGSGLLDAVAVLAREGVVDPSGRFTRRPDKLPADLAARLDQIDGKPAFRLTGAIYLTQGDVRPVQLAKGAVRAGIDVLLARNGLAPEDVDRALIAGSFGYHLTVDSLVDIGLFPPAFHGRVDYVGNTARTGAEALLIHAPSRRRLAQIVAGIEAVDLSADARFTKTFVGALAFPTPTGNAGGAT